MQIRRRDALSRITRSEQDGMHHPRDRITNILQELIRNRQGCTAINVLQTRVILDHVLFWVTHLRIKLCELLAEAHFMTEAGREKEESQSTETTLAEIGEIGASWER